MLFKLSNLNSNLALTLGYLNPALNNSVLDSKIPEKCMLVYTSKMSPRLAGVQRGIQDLEILKSKRNLKCEIVEKGGFLD